MAICLDFDGVLNTYTEYLGDDILFEPAKGVETFLEKLQHEFEQPLIVHTARDKLKVENWLNEYELSQYITEVTPIKKPAVVYIDDRGLKFEGNFKKTLKQVDDFKVWYKSVRALDDWTKDECKFGTLKERGIIP